MKNQGREDESRSEQKKNKQQVGLEREQIGSQGSCMKEGEKNKERMIKHKGSVKGRRLREMGVKWKDGRRGKETSRRERWKEKHWLRKGSIEKGSVLLHI